MANTTRWGLWDSQDNLWLGDGDRPLTFRDHAIARVAAQCAEDMMLGTDLAGRIQAREFPTAMFKLRDEVPVKHTALESLKRIEGEEDRS